MNERIRELAKPYLMYERFSRYGESTEEEYYDFLPEELEEFIQLIVRECATVCEEIAGMAETTNTGEVARKTKATAVSCSNFIKNRFGVKS